VSADRLDLPAGADILIVSNALRESLLGLNGADALDLEVWRREKTAELEAQGIEKAAKLVNAAVKTRQGHSDEGGVTVPALNDPAPWPNPVNGAALLTTLAKTITDYVVVSPGAADALALLVVNAHAHEAADISPIGVLSSPTIRCGKTRLTSLLGGLVPRALVTTAVTGAVVFRAIEAWRPTLLVDEGDTVFGRNGSEELRGILNAGHTRTTAFVPRCVGDNHTPTLFKTWCPKFIALIGKLPASLQDRGVVIPMQRKGRAQQVRRLRLSSVERDLAPLCSEARRWADDHLEELRAAEPATPEELDDRAQDNWRPLLAIADAAGGEWPVRAREAALLLSGAATRVDDEGPSVQILADIRQVFADEKTDQLASATIIERLTALEDRPWTEWRNGKPLTPRGVAELLRPFGIRSGTVRVGGGTPKGYKLEDFCETFAAYFGDSDPPHPQHLNDSVGIRPKLDPPHGGDVADTKPAPSPESDSLVADVADRKSKFRGDMLRIDF
jgi:Protein of unknown function (DUF3631)